MDLIVKIKSRVVIKEGWLSCHFICTFYQVIRADAHASFYLKHTVTFLIRLRSKR